MPADNPFVGQEGVVPETWAYGLRNPWRLTVDPKTGHIWVGNNGQDLWEQVYFVRKGDNFGWSVYEGSHIFYANRTMGPQPLAQPAAEHHHSEARSMTGGSTRSPSMASIIRSAICSARREVETDPMKSRLQGARVRALPPSVSPDR